MKSVSPGQLQGVLEVTTWRKGRPLPAQASRYIQLACCVVLSLVAGVMVVQSRPFAFAIAIAVATAVLATRSTVAWVALAVIVAVAYRGLSGLHAAPGYGQFAHIPLAWGALVVALFRATPGRLGRRSLAWLGLLGFAALASTVINQTEPLRGPVYFLLLAEPFAIICALLIDPPDRRGRRLLLGTCAVLVAIQIPLAYWQALTLGLGDAVQGTLYGSGAGAHVIAAVVIVGAFWFIARSKTPLAPATLLVFAAMLGIILIADAKQVTFALPVIIVAQRSLSIRSVVVTVVAIGAVVAVVQVPALNQGYAVRFLDRALSGHGGKQAVVGVISRSASADPATLVFGQGPAETVSRAAFETLPATGLASANSGSAGSSLQVLGLAPARTANAAQDAAARATGNASLDSFDSATSSGIGLFGDLGLLGLFAFGGLFATVFLNVRRRRSPEAFAAASGLALYFVLGFAFDWWEEPAFTVFLATLTGLALTAPPRDAAA